MSAALTYAFSPSGHTSATVLCSVERKRVVLTHISGSAADAIRREGVVGTDEVARTAVAEGRITLVWEVGVRIYVCHISWRAGRREAEVVALVQSGEVARISVSPT